MSSKYDICTRASVKLGGASVQSFTGSDLSREEEVAGALYEGIKESMIAGYHWNFATTDFVLSPDPTSPTDTKWSYRFNKPSDLNEIINVYDTSSGYPIAWTDEGSWILANQNTATLKYRAKNVDEGDFPPHFEDALVARIAYEMAEPLDADSNTIREKRLEWQLKEQQAQAIDAQSKPPQQLFNSSNSTWVSARRGG